MDTAIWGDYFEDRGNGIRPLGEFAFLFLKKCEENKWKVLYSEPVLLELKEFAEQFYERFSAFKGMVFEVPATEKQVKEARKLARKRNVPFNDAFHAVIARDNKAVLISMDWHFQEKLSDIVECRAPEEIILF